jgi:hypothetical protein
MTNQNPAPATQPTETTPSEEPVVVLTRLQSFTLNHPRLSKGLAIGGALGTVFGVGLAANNIQKNKHHVVSAKDHLELAAGEFTEAVSPTSENTDA